MNFGAELLTRRGALTPSSRLNCCASIDRLGEIRADLQDPSRYQDHGVGLWHGHVELRLSLQPIEAFEPELPMLAESARLEELPQESGFCVDTTSCRFGVSRSWVF